QCWRIVPCSTIQTIRHPWQVTWHCRYCCLLFSSICRIIYTGITNDRHKAWGDLLNCFGHWNRDASDALPPIQNIFFLYLFCLLVFLRRRSITSLLYLHSTIHFCRFCDILFTNCQDSAKHSHIPEEFTHTFLVLLDRTFAFLCSNCQMLVF